MPNCTPSSFKVIIPEVSLITLQIHFFPMLNLSLVGQNDVVQFEFPPHEYFGQLALERDALGVRGLPLAPLAPNLLLRNVQLVAGVAADSENAAH